jgi:hypothetical protein
MLQPPYRYASHSPRTIPYSIVFLCFTGVAAAGYHHVNYFKGFEAREKYDIFYEKMLKVKDVAILFLRISFSAFWSTTSVTYSSNLKQLISSALGGVGRVADIASHMPAMVAATTICGLRMIGGTPRG